MTRFDLKEIERRMRGALGVLKQEFGGLRTGRANAAILDPITVTAYGNPMPMKNTRNNTTRSTSPTRLRA